MVPDVFIDAEGADAVEAGRIIGQRLQCSLDRRPHRVPRGTELTSQSADGGVLPAQLSHCPLHDAGRGGMPRRGKPRQVLHERHTFARPAWADEAAFAPDDRDGAAERGDVDQTHHLPSMPHPGGAAVRASDRSRLGFDGHLQVLATQTRIKDVHVVEPDEKIAADTTGRRCGSGGRPAAPDRLRHGSRPFQDRM